MVSKEDAESNARLVEALFGGVEEAAAAMEKRKDIPSHMQLDLDDDGNPTQLRFAYVDEAECIGCTYCADVAPRHSSSSSLSSSLLIQNAAG